MAGTWVGPPEFRGPNFATDPEFHRRISLRRCHGCTVTGMTIFPAATQPVAGIE